MQCQSGTHPLTSYRNNRNTASANLAKSLEQYIRNIKLYLYFSVELRNINLIRNVKNALNLQISVCVCEHEINNVNIISKRNKASRQDYL